MTDKTINDLGALASPASDDYIPVWDTSAGQTLKITRANYIGATITGGGTLATGGYTLTVPASGTAALIGSAQTFSGANTFSAGQTMAAVSSSGSNTINDDAAISFIPSAVTATSLPAGVYSGLLLIWGRFGGGTNQAAVISFRAGSSNWCAVVAQPSTLVAATTGPLGGTGWTDGKLNISTHTDGKIYIENRTGAQINLGYMVLG